MKKITKKYHSSTITKTTTLSTNSYKYSEVHSVKWNVAASAAAGDDDAAVDDDNWILWLYLCMSMFIYLK